MTAAEWIARARAVTDGATSGPWEAVGPYIEAAGEDFAEVCMDVDGSDDERSPIDAAFIAASRTMLPAAVAAIEAVLALHERVTRWGNEDYSISQDGYDDAEPEDRTSLTAFDVCAECFRIEQTSDQHDGDECAHAVLDGLWPCPTVRALTAHLDPS